MCVCTGVCVYTHGGVCVCVCAGVRAWGTARSRGWAFTRPSNTRWAPELSRGGELHRLASGPFGTDVLATPCAGLEVSLGLGCDRAAA